MSSLPLGKVFFIVTLLMSTVFLGMSGRLYAQEGMSLTVTPPLFQLSISPGETWTSSVKVVNNNAFPLTVYVSPLNFEAEGESGQGKFIPRIEETDEEGGKGLTLASWITVSEDAFVIPPEQTISVPFAVTVPIDASPGGHYAALLIGNSPEKESVDEGPRVSVSSQISSLLFVNIAGDVVEDAHIRDFYTEKFLYQTQEATFFLRFENKGNVHLRPQGDILILNMWGKERGSIPVNQKTEFGNVLPGSTRKFVFEWKGEQNIFEIGRYKAIATLTYGTAVKQNTDHITYFWVVPVVPVLSIVGTLGAFILFMVWALRRYIRNALILAGVEPKKKHGQKSGHVQHPPTLTLLAKPLIQGAVDLRSIKVRTEGSKHSKMTLGRYLRTYKFFFIFLGVLMCGVWAFYVFLGEVLISERDYEVVIKRDGAEDIVIDSEDNPQGQEASN